MKWMMLFTLLTILVLAVKYYLEARCEWKKDWDGCTNKGWDPER